jgi:hypothetical protein
VTGDIKVGIKVEAKSKDVTVNSTVEDLLKVEAIEDIKAELKRGATRSICIHPSQDKDGLLFLMIIPWVANVPADKQKESLNVTYRECPDGTTTSYAGNTGRKKGSQTGEDWLPLGGPQLFINGGTRWFPNNAQ